MSDLIDKQTLREDIEKIYKYDCQTFVMHYAQLIDDLSSAEPERKAKVEISDGWFCCCGCNYCTEHYSDDWKYCPMCGCRLEWE